MKALYIGILTSGTTSRMRAERLKALLPQAEWQWINTDEPMRGCARIWQSLAFRLKWGVAVNRINEAVVAGVSGGRYDLVWVDKGVFLTRKTLQFVRERAVKLVHFTPDTAFLGNRSRHFERGLRDYDVVISTKSFELEDYRQRGVKEENLVWMTQGYDPQMHWPRFPDVPRRREVAFVGLAEPDRENCLGTLLEAGVTVRVGGKGWRRFVERYANCAHLIFEGEAVFGEAYSALYSKVWIGLGLLSKRFPELHTTRTFEIPACGAILATERNGETGEFFSGEEALFFRNHADLATGVQALFAGPERELETMASAGFQRVRSSGRDYDSLLGNVLNKLSVSP